jgi:hypothetical protein
MARKSGTEQLWDNKRANVSDILAHFTCESSLAAISPKFPSSALEAKVTGGKAEDKEREMNQNRLGTLRCKWFFVERTDMLPTSI